MLNRAFLSIALATAVIGGALAQEADLPDVKSARVTIPYSELKELWKAAQQNNRPPPAKPPLPAELSSAHYEIEVRENRVVGSVELDAQSFTDDWNALPLIGSEMQLHKVEPAEANIILRDGNYALLTNRPAKQHIKMYFAAPLVQEGGGSRLQIPNAPAVVNLITVKGVPSDKILRVSHGTEISSDKAVTNFQVAPNEPIELRFLPATTKPAPSQWEISAQCLVTYFDDTLRYHAQVGATASGGSALTIDLTLPLAARIVSVTGEDLASWHSEEVASKTRVIGLQWRTPGISSRRIEIVYELPQSLESEWILHAPELENGKTQPPIFAVNAGTEIELAKTSSETPPLPRWLAEQLGGIANVVVTREARVTAKPLPVVNVTPAVVDTAEFNTRIVADGSLISEQIYSIRTTSSVVWTVDLPNNSELLSFSVEDHRVNPVNRGNGTLEVSIAPNAAGKVTRIALSYTAHTAPFQPVSGRIKVELPKTPLLINSLTWNLAIPAEYEVAALEGNLTPTAGSQRDGSTVVCLKKELCRNERPNLELFYQKPEVKK